MKRLFSFLLILTLFSASLLLVACEETTVQSSQYGELDEFGIYDKTDPFVELTISTGDVILLELYPSVAPLSVENFLKYVKDGFYDGVIFHRIIQGFMIQTGGFIEVDGVGVHKDATYPAIKGEFSANKVTNTLKHTRGVVSMARSNAYDSASSQFFICSADYPSLNGKYAAFGCVVGSKSMETVSKLEKVQTTTKGLVYGTLSQPSEDVPVTFPKIVTARVVTVE